MTTTENNTSPKAVNGIVIAAATLGAVASLIIVAIAAVLYYQKRQRRNRRTARPDSSTTRNLIGGHQYSGVRRGSFDDQKPFKGHDADVLANFQASPRSSLVSEWLSDLSQPHAPSSSGHDSGSPASRPSVVPHSQTYPLYPPQRDHDMYDAYEPKAQSQVFLTNTERDQFTLHQYPTWSGSSHSMSGHSRTGSGKYDGIMKLERLAP